MPAATRSWVEENERKETGENPSHRVTLLTNDRILVANLVFHCVLHKAAE